MLFSPKTHLKSNSKAKMLPNNRIPLIYLFKLYYINLPIQIVFSTLCGAKAGTHNFRCPTNYTALDIFHIFQLIDILDYQIRFNNIFGPLHKIFENAVPLQITLEIIHSLRD